MAFLSVGIGLIGMALVIGGDFVGLGGMEAVFSYLMILGFVGATIFGFIAGGKPVPAGTAHIEMEDRVQVKMSDELRDEIKERVDKALDRVVNQNEDAVAKATTAAESIMGDIEQLRTKIEEINLDEVADQLQNIATKSSKIDADTALESIESLQGNVNSVNDKLADLMNLSTNEAERLENTVTEVSENLNSLIETFRGMEQEVNKSLKQFENFNSL